jgi:hypothetical protein
MHNFPSDIFLICFNDLDDRVVRVLWAPHRALPAQAGFGGHLSGGILFIIKDKSYDSNN